MRNISFPLLLAGVAISSSAMAQKAQKTVSKEAPVNFVIINLDDMGYGDLTVTGASGYRTPNIDRLCAEGMRFTQFYAAQAVSSASRAGLLTGCYPNRIGFRGALVPGDSINLKNEQTIGDILCTKGYATAIIGKWHLGDKPEFMPLHHGFNYYFGLPYSNDMWPFNPNKAQEWPPLPLYENDNVINVNVMPDDQRQLTTQYTEHAVNFINKSVASGKPFFVYLAHSMPHVPLYVSDKFEGKSKQGKYGDVMMEIDWSVGQVVAALKDNKIEKRTLLIFTSDNGPWLCYGNHAGSTGGLREGKGNSFEGGQRVPCIIWQPGTVSPGIVNNALLSAIDVLPTIADIAGANLPVKKIDGISFRSLLTGDGSEPSPRKDFLYYYRKNSLEAVRNDRFKLVFNHKGRSYEGFLPGNDGARGKVNEERPFSRALYDLRRDPGERYNVYDQYPEVVATLEAIAENARQDLGDDLTGREGTGRRLSGSVHNDKKK